MTSSLFVFTLALAASIHDKRWANAIEKESAVQELEKKQEEMQEDDNDKMMAYERMRDSADEMAEQKDEMNKQLKAAGAQDMISSPEQIEDEVNSRMDQQANGER